MLYRPPPRETYRHPGAMAQDVRVLGLNIAGHTPRRDEAPTPARPKSAAARSEVSPRRSPRLCPRPKSAGAPKSSGERPLVGSFQRETDVKRPLDMTVTNGRAAAGWEQSKARAASAVSLDIDAALEKALDALDRLAAGIEPDDEPPKARPTARDGDGDSRQSRELAVSGAWPRQEATLPQKPVKVSTLDIREKVARKRPKSAAPLRKNFERASGGAPHRIGDAKVISVEMPTLQPNKPRRPQSAPAARRAPEPPMPNEIGAAVLVRQFVPAPAREEPREPGNPEPRPTTVRKLMVSIPTLGAAAAGNDARAAAPEEEAPWDSGASGASRDDLVYSDDDSVVLSPRRSHLEQVDWRPASARDRGFRGDAAYVLDEPASREDPGDDVPIVARAVVAAPPRRPASAPAARKPRKPRRPGAADRVAPPPPTQRTAAMAPPVGVSRRASVDEPPATPLAALAARANPAGSAPDGTANRRERALIAGLARDVGAALDVEGFGHVAKLADAEAPAGPALVVGLPAGAAVRVSGPALDPEVLGLVLLALEWLRHLRLAHDDPRQRRTLPPEAFAAAARGGAPLEAARAQAAAAAAREASLAPGAHAPGAAAPGRRRSSAVRRRASAAPAKPGDVKSALKDKLAKRKSAARKKSQAPPARAAWRAAKRAARDAAAHVRALEARRNALLLGPDGALWSDASLYTLESPKTLGAVVRALARHQPFRAPGGFRNPDPTARAVAEKRRAASELFREVVSDY